MIVNPPRSRLRGVLLALLVESAGADGAPPRVTARIAWLADTDEVSVTALVTLPETPPAIALSVSARGILAFEGSRERILTEITSPDRSDLDLAGCEPSPWRSSHPRARASESVRTFRVEGGALSGPLGLHYRLPAPGPRPAAGPREQVFLGSAEALPVTCVTREGLRSLEFLRPYEVELDLPPGWLGHAGAGSVGGPRFRGEGKPHVTFGRFTSRSLDRPGLQGTFLTRRDRPPGEGILDALEAVARHFADQLGPPPAGPLTLIEGEEGPLHAVDRTLWLPPSFLEGPVSFSRYFEVAHEWGHRYNHDDRWQVGCLRAMREGLSHYWALGAVEARYGSREADWLVFENRRDLQGAVWAACPLPGGLAGGGTPAASIPISDLLHEYPLGMTFWLELELLVGRDALGAALATMHRQPLRELRSFDDLVDMLPDEVRSLARGHGRAWFAGGAGPAEVALIPGPGGVTVVNRGARAVRVGLSRGAAADDLLLAAGESHPVTEITTGPLEIVGGPGLLQSTYGDDSFPPRRIQLSLTGRRPGVAAPARITFWSRFPGVEAGQWTDDFVAATGEDGPWTIDRFPAGEYFVTASAPGHLVAHAEVSLTPGDHPVTLRLRPVEKVAVWIMDPAGRTITHRPMKAGKDGSRRLRLTVDEPGATALPYVLMLEAADGSRSGVVDPRSPARDPESVLWGQLRPPFTRERPRLFRHDDRTVYPYWYIGSSGKKRYRPMQYPPRP